LHPSRSSAILQRNYDAAGNAGIINIRLKKNQAYGTNMTVSAGYNIGTYSKYNGAFSSTTATGMVKEYRVDVDFLSRWLKEKAPLYLL